MSRPTARTAYSPAETLSDAITHVVGLVAALVAVPVLITITAFLRGDTAALVGTSVYGATLIGMILCSMLYNLIRHPGWQTVLRRLDHSAIYAKIAGTYTPFTLLSGQGIWFLLGIWGAALVGIALKIAAPHRFRWLGLALYLGLGWAGLWAGAGFLAALSAPVLVLILTGGALYTLGVVFYLFDRLPFHYTIWHVLVLAASFTFYAAITVLVVQSA